MSVARDRSLSLPGGVNYDANDRFCREGQRLVAISGAYGADGTEYRTEVDSFSRILSHGVAGTGPAWFEVHTKSGQAMELGRTADSQTVNSGSDLDGTALPTVTTTSQYDGYNNVTQVAVSTPDGFSKTTNNTYTNDATNWYLGRLTRASVTSVAP